MIVIRLLERLRHWQRDRQTIDDLLSRSDHDLGDIGLRRADVPRAVRHGARPLTR